MSYSRFKFECHKHAWSSYNASCPHCINEELAGKVERLESLLDRVEESGHLVTTDQVRAALEEK